jgi:hypothetical protein
MTGFKAAVEMASSMEERESISCRVAGELAVLCLIEEAAKASSKITRLGSMNFNAFLGWFASTFERKVAIRDCSIVEISLRFLKASAESHQTGA